MILFSHSLEVFDRKTYSKLNKLIVVVVKTTKNYNYMVIDVVLTNFVFVV